MEKLPVFRTAGNAIGFTLWNSFTIFRLAWLPFTALFAAEFGLAYFIMSSLGETLDRAPNPMTIGLIFEKVFALNLAIMVLQAIVIASVAVSIHRVILFGDRRPGEFFTFAFGKTEFIYLMMGVLSALFFLIVLAAVFTPLVLFISSGDPIGLFKEIAENPKRIEKIIDPKQGTFFAIMGVYLVAWFFLVYLSLRLSVWPPAVVATNRLSPSEPWQLMRGNVWRMIGTVFLTFGWIYVVMLVVLAGSAFTYYRAKMEKMPEPPAIAAPAEPTAAAPSAPAPDAANTPAAEAATPSSTTATTPAPVQPASPAPEAKPENALPAAPEPAEPMSEDEAREQLDEMFGPYALAMWVIQLLMFIYFTALGVAMVSYSYKALKGYDAREPIPAD